MTTKSQATRPRKKGPADLAVRPEQAPEVSPTPPAPPATPESALTVIGDVPAETVETLRRTYPGAYVTRQGSILIIEPR